MAELKLGTTIGGYRQLHEGITNPTLNSDTTINGNIKTTGSLIFKDENKYIIYFDGFPTWGIYWDTNYNQFQFRGAGQNKVTINLDDGAVWTDGTITQAGFNGNQSTQSKLQTQRTISLSGAVTGSASFDGSQNITISTSVNHTHDDRYYTESEVDTALARKSDVGHTHTKNEITDINTASVNYASSAGNSDTVDGLHASSFARIDGKTVKYSAFGLSPGWYTIAVNRGDKAVARFGIRDIYSGAHQNVVFYASHMFGAHSEITVLHSSRFSTTPIRYIRIKEGGTYDGALLQIYVDTSSNDLEVYLLGDNFQSSGWILKNFVPDGTDPGNVNNFSALTNVAAQVDLDTIIDGGMATTGEIYAGGKTTQYKVWHAGNDGSGSGLDADLLDGKHASDFATASHNHDSAYVKLSGSQMTGTLTVPLLQIDDSYTKLDKGQSNQLRIQTNYGYIDIGPQNTSYAHIYTDRPQFYFNKDIKGQGKVWGAVYNDYQEYRLQKEEIEPGYVAITDTDGRVKKCNKDRQRNIAGVVSDVFGFAIGKVKGEISVPIQVAGRVLIYQKDKHKLKQGDQVCSTKDGRVRKMKWWEKILFPEQIVGYVDEIPTYEEWGQDKIKVNKRIWIRLK